MVTLTGKNRSQEHVIPENIGGKLKSKDLICRECNSRFGESIDDALLVRFKIIDMNLDLKKKRKYKTNKKAIYKGKEYKFDKNGPTKIIEVIEEEDKKHYIFPSEKSLRAHLEKYNRRLEKLGKSVDIEARISNARREREVIDEPFYITSEGDDSETWRCCGKIVYEFLYLINRNYTPSNTQFKDFINGDIDEECYPICFGDLNYNPIERDQDKLYHTIVIEGRKEDKILMGYLEIFGAFKTIMIIDDEYVGEDFIRGYCHDLMDNYHDFINPDVRMPISSHNLREFITNCSADNILYQLQIELYRRGVALVAYKARYYHFKKLLLSLKEEYNIPDISLTENNTAKFLDTILNEFIRRGIEIRYIEEVQEEDKGAENVQKIILLLDYLRMLFRETGLDQTMVSLMIDFFQEKGAKFKKREG